MNEYIRYAGATSTATTNSGGGWNGANEREGAAREKLQQKLHGAWLLSAPQWGGVCLSGIVCLSGVAGAFTLAACIRVVYM